MVTRFYPATMATLTSVFCLFTIQALVLINTADAGLKLVATPNLIEFGITPTLDINCTLTKAGYSNLPESTYLYVYRQSYLGDFDTPVATLQESNIIDTKEMGISATGVLNIAGESFLHVRWENPTVLQVGMYWCEAIASGFRDASIEYVNGDILGYFVGIEKKVDSIEQNVQAMEKSMSNLVETVQSFAHIHIGSYQETDYFLSKQQVGRFYFSDNLDICKSFGGQLLEINDANEQTAVRGFLDAVSGIDWVQVGGTDKASEGNWVFPSTNQPMTYTNWMSGHPVTSSTKNCVWLSGDNSWQMYDSVCDYDTAESSWRYMCEIPRQ